MSISDNAPTTETLTIARDAVRQSFGPSKNKPHFRLLKDSHGRYYRRLPGDQIRQLHRGGRNHPPLPHEKEAPPPPPPHPGSPVPNIR